jgi:hypothetical protein
MNFWAIFILTMVLIGLGMLGIAIKMFFKKDGKFEGTCASMNPETNDSGVCQFCGRTKEEYEGNCSREILKKIIEEKKKNERNIFNPDEYLNESFEG